MTILFLSAMTLGMIGSFHCVGMCGPLALSLPLKNDNDWSRFFSSFLYNMGRVTTYSLLGVIFGFAGKSFSIFGFQQGLSIILGIFILLFLFTSKSQSTNNRKYFQWPAFNETIRALLGQLFFKKSNWSLYAIGILNGLLPCGLIYIAIAGAIATADPIRSSFFMASFGLGTLPVMWTVSFFGNYVGLGVRKKMRRIYPVMMGLTACLLIIRGMGLDIPYISPLKIHNLKEVQKCYPILRNKQSAI
jgi:sulfite exporter TauE/SafE